MGTRVLASRSGAESRGIGNLRYNSSPRRHFLLTILSTRARRAMPVTITGTVRSSPNVGHTLAIQTQPPV